MRRLLLAAAATLFAIAAYLLAWPVPVEPVAWSAPADAGLTGAFTPNEILALAQSIDTAAHDGPEDVALGADGDLYASMRDGVLLCLSRHGGAPQVFATTGGRPLGIEALPDGSFVVANAVIGLQRVLPDGTPETLVDRVDGEPLRYVNDVAVAPDGKIYFTEATTRFGAADYGGTLEASVLDIVEHGGHGLLIEFEPATGTARVLLDSLDYANGVAVSDDGRFLLVAETGSYRILRHWLEGDRAGTTDVLVDNLPGFPDNINNGLNGRFWIGLAAPRNPMLDRYSGRPFVRKLMMRLPAFLRPKPARSSHVIAINGMGEVLMNLQDPDARFPMLTGALEVTDRIYLTTLAGAELPYINKSDLL